MSVGAEQVDAMPVVRDLKEFDINSGILLERIIFNYRLWIILACVVITGFMGYQLTNLVFNASFEKMLPQSHPYIKNYLDNQADLRSMGNSMRIVVENVDGTIYDKEFLEKVRDINDALFLVPGVDRSWMKSLWTPLVRWVEVTEEGFRGGPVMPPAYDGSPQSIADLEANVRRASLVGSLVSNDLKSTMIIVPLLDKSQESGERLNYGALSRMLEKDVRGKYETQKQLEDAANAVAAKSGGHVKVYMVGFAKMVGDLIDGIFRVMTYFGMAAVIAAIVLYFYTHCIRSTLLVIMCSVIAVEWQLGIVTMLGYEMDPYVVLVPFLVFAIGVSHGAQKMNGIQQDVGRGTVKYVAARYTFRRLFMAGLMALLADAVGFGVLMIIDIPVIRDLTLTASIGVALLVFTNLMLLPILLSYVGVSEEAGRRSLATENAEKTGGGMAKVWGFLDKFTERQWAVPALVVAAVLAAVGFVISQDLKIGDLDPGAPELRPDSRYNTDNAYITSHYRLSSDVFAVIVKNPEQRCSTYKNMVEMDRLAQELDQEESVQLTVTLPQLMAFTASGTYEGNPKWFSISRDEKVLQSSQNSIASNQSDLSTVFCNITPILVYLKDHKAETLEHILAHVEKFGRDHNEPDMMFLPAAGSAGIEAVTNLVVKEANRTMLLYVYGAVILLCFIAFRSWKAVIVAVVPLALTSILCEALMVKLGIGVKVATLPVIALGVGIGVDYALYLLSVQLAKQRSGMTLKDAYKGALGFTGRVVALVGFTLAAGVVTWAWSPIKFQADMGILLTFMFLWNMLGALVLIPALSHFLLKNEGMAPAK